MVEDIKIPKNFQQTEVGVIPEDWDALNLGSFTDLLTGFPFPSAKFAKSGIRLLRGFNIKRGNTDWSDDITKYWHSTTFELRTFELRNGDIVVAMDGSLVGKSFAQLTSNDLPALLLQRVARLRTEKADINYLKQFVCSNFFTQHCESVKTASAIPHISPKNIKDFKIPLPPTFAEQTAIATVLSDMDGLIEGLEKLLVKKRNIKQGTMQELLTPKEGWEVVDFETLITSTQLGSNYPNNEIDNGVPLIKMGNLGRGSITLKKLEFIQSAAVPLEKDILKYGDVLFNTRNTLELVGKVAIWRNELSKAYFNSNIIRFKFDPKKIESNFYMNYILNSMQLITQLKNIATGTTSVAAIYIRDLFKIQIPLPPTKAEQTTIATVLSDMDTEIEQLETQLSKYKMLKTGMMQELLTGKKRLI